MRLLINILSIYLSTLNMGWIFYYLKQNNPITTVIYTAKIIAKKNDYGIVFLLC